MKRVLIITYYWPPSGGAGVQRWVKFVKYLPLSGWHPMVLTVDPGKATYPQRDESLLKEVDPSVPVFHTMTREIYSWYKNISSNKEVPYGGFVNTPTLDLKEKILRFIRGNFFLPDPRKGWNRYAYKKAVELIREYEITHVITTSPPHSTQLIGRKLKKKTDVRWVADLRDPWTDIYYGPQLYPAFWANWYNRFQEKRMINTADTVIVVSREMKNSFLRKMEVSPRKIQVIHNGYDEEDFIRLPAIDPGSELVITYAGTIASGYNTDGLLMAFSLLSEAERALFHFRFIGKMSSEIYKKFRNSLPEAQFESLGYLEHAEIPGSLAQSFALLLVIPDVENNKGILTGKLFEYLASGRPVLLLGPVDGDAAAIIRETACGFVCDPGDFESIGRVLKKLVEEYIGNPGKTYGNNKVSGYSRKALTAKLADCLNSPAAGKED